MDWSVIAIVLVVAFSVNIPLGKWRSYQRKRSIKWFLGIHMSTPLLVPLRILLGGPLALIPFIIIAAIAGQMVGARLPLTYPFLSRVK